MRCRLVLASLAVAGLCGPGAAPAAAAPPLRTAIATDMDRPDLEFPLFWGYGNYFSPVDVDVKGLKPPYAPYLPSFKMVVGENPPYQFFTCLRPRGCQRSVDAGVPARPFGYGRLHVRDYLTFSTRFYVGAAVYMPDQVKRKTKGDRSSITLKQKRNVAIFLGRRDLIASPGLDSSTYRVLPGCKGQAQTRLDEAKGEIRSKLKVSCKESEIDALDPAWRARLILMGLKKAKFDFRGQRNF